MQTRLWLLALLVLAPVTGAAAQAAQQALHLALTKPAIDGVVLGGVRLGTAEAEIVARFGPPEVTDLSPLGGRWLRWEPMPEVWLEVHVDGGIARAIGVSSIGDAPPVSLETVRAIRLGSPVGHVLERYGAPGADRLWYAPEGIAFNLDAPGATVESILIFPRGTPAP